VVPHCPREPRAPQPEPRERVLAGAQGFGTVPNQLGDRPITTSFAAHELAHRAVR
jgi:hypothetical protein